MRRRRALVVCLGGILLLGLTGNRILSIGAMQEREDPPQRMENLCDWVTGTANALNGLVGPEDVNERMRTVVASAAVLEILIADVRVQDPEFRCYEWDLQ